jgi:hypothetical protein
MAAFNKYRTPSNFVDRNTKVATWCFEIASRILPYQQEQNLLLQQLMKTRRIENLNRPIRMDKSQKLFCLMDYLRSLNEENFTGSIKINFSQGSIARVEKFEEISKKLTF